MTSKIILTDNLKIKTIIHALRLVDFWVIQSLLQHGQILMKHFSLSTCQLVLSGTVWPVSHCAEYLPYLFLHFSRDGSLAAGLLPQLFKSHWATGTQIKFYHLHHFFSGTIAYNFFPLNSLFLQHYSVNPIIICIITLFLYVLSLPTIMPVTEGRNISLHHHHPML